MDLVRVDSSRVHPCRINSVCQFTTLSVIVNRDVISALFFLPPSPSIDIPGSQNLTTICCGKANFFKKKLILQCKIFYLYLYL